MDPVISSPAVPAASARNVVPAGGMGEVARLAYPIVLTQMSQTVMHVVDSIFVGRLGAAELGALGFAGIWLWTVFSVFSGTATGVQTFVSQAWGAGEERSCGRYAWQGLYAIAPAAFLAALAFVAVAEPTWRALGATPEVREHALAYAHIRPFGILGLAFWQVLAVVLPRRRRHAHAAAWPPSSRTRATRSWPTASCSAGSGCRGWGVAGAAAATSIAEWIGAAVLAAVFLGRASRRRYGTRRSRPTRPRSAASCAPAPRSAASGCST